jgi:electron transfer flavoprotein alpha subunit
MTIVAIAEQRDGKFKQSAFEVVRAARTLADTLGGECCAIVVGSGAASIAGQLGGYGASRVIAVDDPRLQQYSTTAYAKAVALAVQKMQASVVLLTANSMGKDLAPRVSVKLDAGIAPDCTALTVESGEIVATRPVYAGKALLDVRVTTPVKVFTLRPNVFAVGTSSGQSAPVETLPVDFTDADFSVVVNEVRIAEGRSDVTEANIVVSGGRGMKGPENFHLIEKLADVLHGAVGASRAVVDAKWRPHDEQVGQTGKTVSPSLYIACGISGAIQHIAGMSSSKYIVAINKDKDAPIFQIADYGIVGDALEILPVLTQEIEKKIGA